MQSRRFASALLALFALLPLVACSKGGVPDDKATAKLSAYNHTPDYIHQYYVDEEWGGNSFAYGGGGSFVCCIVYPRQWQPGLSATVKWTTSSSDPSVKANPIWHEKVVPIERYDQPGTTLNVHFLPKGEVRLIISSMGAGHPQYPGPDAPVKPDDFPFQR